MHRFEVLLHGPIFVPQHLVTCVLRLKKKENVATPKLIRYSHPNQVITNDSTIETGSDDCNTSY